MKLLILLVCLLGLQSAFGGVTCDQDKLTAMEEQLTVLYKQMTIQNEKIEALEKRAMTRHELEENQIAFSVASHQNFGGVTVDTNIEFPLVHTNVGNGWHPGTNAFQAPKAGFYLFHFSFRGNKAGETWAAIVHTTVSGSESIAGLNSESSLNTGDANAAIIYVAAGDFVSARLLAGSGMIGSDSYTPFTIFSGHYLFP